MACELAIAVPHGAFERECQLVATPPSLDVNKLVARESAERDRSRRSPKAGPTRERNDRDPRPATLELLPYSLATRQLAPPGTQPGRMRLGSLTTRRRVARVAGRRLAGRARALAPAPRNVHPLRRTRALTRRVPIMSAARARRRPAVRTPLTQPCPAVAHGRSRAFAPRRWSPFWSPFSWRDLTFDGSRWRTSPRVASTRVLLLTRSDSVRPTGATGLEPATSGVTGQRSFVAPKAAVGSTSGPPLSPGAPHSVAHNGVLVTTGWTCPARPQPPRLETLRSASSDLDAPLVHPKTQLA
jgi:hypothetical protein